VDIEIQEPTGKFAVGQNSIREAEGVCPQPPGVVGRPTSAVNRSLDHIQTVSMILKGLGVDPNVAQHSFWLHAFLIDNEQLLEAKGVGDREFLIGEQRPPKLVLADPFTAKIYKPGEQRLLGLVQADPFTAKIYKQVTIAVLQLPDYSTSDIENGLDIDRKINAKTAFPEQAT
jgi:hypothetical protein